MSRFGMKTFSLSIATILTLASSAASAQQNVIDHCKQMSNKDDRIACLEAALMMRDSGSTHIESHEFTAKSEPADINTASPLASSDSAAAPAVLASVDAQATDIGAEQVIAREQTQEQRLAALKNAAGLAVAKYESIAHDRLQVTLQNGQVWRQIRGDTQKVYATLKKNQTVDISESSLGGYKLRLNEMRRTIRVQRVR